MVRSSSVLQAGRRVLKNLLRDAVLNPLWASPLIPTEARWRLLRIAGLDVQRSHIAFGGWLGSRRIAIGKNVYINAHVFLDNSDWIRLEDRVSVGPHVRILTSTHEMGTKLRRAGQAVAKPVTVGAGAWIGAGSIILPGVAVGPGTVIAAGSVVSSDCAGNALYAGVPARLVRELDN